MSTVTRTTAKIRTAITDLSDWTPCALCLAPLPADPAAQTHHLCYGCEQLTRDTEGLDAEGGGEVCAKALPPYVQALLYT